MSMAVVMGRQKEDTSPAARQVGLHGRVVEDRD